MHGASLAQELDTCLGLPRRHSDANDAQVKLEGYLFKRTTNAFKSWVRFVQAIPYTCCSCTPRSSLRVRPRFRRWFVIQKNQLVYRKRSRDTLTVMEHDLRLCTAKKVSDTDRRFCFELISPKG